MWVGSTTHTGESALPLPPMLPFLVKTKAGKKAESAPRKPEFQYIFNTWGFKLVKAYQSSQ
jgi:hypothetical protein